MPEISRLRGNIDWIDLDFVERERTPERAMKLGIQLHWRDCHFRISLFLMSWVSNALERLSTIGFRTLIYSQTTAKLRIWLRSMKV